MAGASQEIFERQGIILEEQETYSGKPLKKKYIELKLTKHTLFLTEAELASLLAHEPALWREAVKRGKAFLRKRQARDRKPPVKVSAEQQTGFLGGIRNRNTY